MPFRKKLKTLKKQFRIRRELDLLPTARERQQIDIGSTMQRAVQYILGAEVEGDLVEFGTATGFTASALARTLKELERRSDRSLWLFDSFEGLPEAAAEADRLSPHVASGVWGKGTCRGLTAQGLMKQVAQFIDQSRVRVNEGWFANTVASIPNTSRFALVHVDGDLYQSAIDCLSPLFERKLLSKGAVIVFDDWNCGRADNNLGERRAWREISETYTAEYEDFGHQSWAGRSIILHSYR
jgi:O-methyltransferase